MLTYFTEVSVILLLAYLFYCGLLRPDTFFQRNRYYLLLMPFLALLIPLLELEGWVSTATNQTGAALNLQEFVVGLSAWEAQPSSGMSFRTNLWYVYHLGCLLMFLRFAYQLLRMHQLITRSPKLGRAGYTLIYTQGKMPTFSFFNYLFWDNGQKLSPEEEAQMLRHEFKHMQDRHSWDVIYMELLKIFLWFNPLIYLYDRSLRFQHEYMADAFATQRGKLKNYGRLMVNTCFQQLNLQLVHSFSRYEIKHRLRKMHQIQSPPVQKLKVLLILPLLLLLTYTFAQHREEVRPQASLSSELISPTESSPVKNRLATAQGGLDGFYQELARHLKYPRSARKAGIEGRVFLQFTVNKQGKLEDIKVIKSLHPDCDRAAMEAIQKTRWTPAMVDGELVKQQLSLPIFFKLNSAKN